ncbi:hypothetical protein [Halodurantibacterium flavum]|uniref:Uncharacterized protein n=1 Tax=Halodurantibacterium flavum TaxID=1382802 RepID=A0ABW4RZN0_9RHOB
MIDFARDGFGRYVDGLFSDPRVKIPPEGGRPCLVRSITRRISFRTLALVGHNDAVPLDPATLPAHWRAMTGEESPDHVLIVRALKFYADNDGHPLIEHRARGRIAT